VDDYVDRKRGLRIVGPNDSRNGKTPYTLVVARDVPGFGIWRQNPSNSCRAKLATRISATSQKAVPLKFLVIATGVLLIVGLLAFYLWTPDRDRASLEAKYLDAPTDMLEVDGVRLHVRDSGPRNGLALIFLHGFGASLHTWEPWARDLAHDYRVIRFDLPGSGLSSADPTGDYTDARSMALLAALMDKLGVKRASIVGHSIGGRIAWTFAAHYPERVDKLVLVAPDGFASPGFEYGKKPDVPASVKLMRYVLPKPLLRMSLAPAYANPATLTDALAARYYDLMLAPGARQALIARMEQTTLTDPVPWLRRIQAPTLLLWGQQDAMIPFANSADYLKALPHATLAPVPGVGHLPQEEAPERALIPVRAFLQCGALSCPP
jgi:pimeloyl-ACP methyl ester carboxylesterase